MSKLCESDLSDNTIANYLNVILRMYNFFQERYHFTKDNFGSFISLRMNFHRREGKLTVREENPAAMAATEAAIWLLLDDG